MKLSSPRIALSKIPKHFSLPKLINKIQHNRKLTDNERLHFPIKDDANFVRGVGRKHYEHNRVSSLGKIFNPQYIYQQEPTYNSNKKIFHRNLQSLANQPPYHLQRSEQKMQQIIRMKTNLDSAFQPQILNPHNQPHTSKPFTPRKSNNIGVQRLQTDQMIGHVKTDLPTPNRLQTEQASLLRNNGSFKIERKQSGQASSIRRMSPTYISSQL